MWVYIQQHPHSDCEDRVGLTEISEPTALQPGHCVLMLQCGGHGAKWPSAAWGCMAKLAEALRSDLPQLCRNTQNHLCSWVSFSRPLFPYCLPLIPLKHLCFWASISCRFPRQSSLYSSFVVSLDPAGSKTSQCMKEGDGNWSIGNYKLYLVSIPAAIVSSRSTSNFWLATELHILFHTN